MNASNRESTIEMEMLTGRYIYTHKVSFILSMVNKKSPLNESILLRIYKYIYEFVLLFVPFLDPSNLCSCNLHDVQSCTKQYPGEDNSRLLNISYYR